MIIAWSKISFINGIGIMDFNLIGLTGFFSIQKSKLVILAADI